MPAFTSAKSVSLAWNVSDTNSDSSSLFGEEIDDKASTEASALGNSLASRAAEGFAVLFGGWLSVLPIVACATVATDAVCLRNYKEKPKKYTQTNEIMTKPKIGQKQHKICRPKICPISK